MVCFDSTAAFTLAVAVAVPVAVAVTVAVDVAVSRAMLSAVMCEVCSRGLEIGDRDESFLEPAVGEVDSAGGSCGETGMGGRAFGGFE